MQLVELLDYGITVIALALMYLLVRTFLRALEKQRQEHREVICNHLAHSDDVGEKQQDRRRQEAPDDVSIERSHGIRPYRRARRT